MEENNYYLNHLNEIKKSCEILITETQCDIEIFKNEQRHLHKQIQDIQVENNLINSKLDELRHATSQISPTTLRNGGETRDDATREKFTHEALLNVQKQIEYLQTENNELPSMNKTQKKTIECLENEIQNFRNQLFNPAPISEIKQKYGTLNKLLENTIKRQNAELKEQSQAIETLIEQKKHLSDHIEKANKLLEEKSNELEKFAGTNETISKLESQLSEIQRHNTELQKALKISKQAIEKRYMKEQSALQKVQEALSIAEAAEADKLEALKRERVVKEECENIASTIGHVMDEAARKVESDKEAIKNKYIEKEKIISAQKDKLVEEIKSQKKFIHILDTRCQRFKQKYEEVAKDNDNLSDQLEQAAKALWNLEEKVKKLEHQSNEGCLQTNSTEQDNQTQEQFLKSNRLLREKYHKVTVDLTDKFKKEIHILKEEITRLKLENESKKSETNK